MNEPILGLCIGVMLCTSFFAGYGIGQSAGYHRGLLKAKNLPAQPTPGPKVKASWLRRNWFRLRQPSQKELIFK